MTSADGSLTAPLPDPDDELAAARVELERARDRMTRHALRPGGPDPHTAEWLSRAERRVTAAEARLADPGDESDRAEPVDPPTTETPPRYVLSNRMPRYSRARALLDLLPAIAPSALSALDDRIRSQRGSVAEPVDWTDPDSWIPTRLDGDDASLARTLWQAGIHPRYVYRERRFLVRHGFVTEGADDEFRVTDRGARFADADPDLIRELDQQEGMFEILRALAARGPQRRSDLLPAWTTFLEREIGPRADQVVSDGLRRRVNDLVDRGLVAQQGQSFKLTPAGEAHLETAPAPPPPTEVVDERVHEPPTSVRAAWLVIQKEDSSYGDIEGRAYRYPVSHPNAKRIAANDLIVVARPMRQQDADGGRIVGVGHIDRIEPDDDHTIAWFGWYTALTPPVSFEDAGGDPRANFQHAMNPAPLEWVRRAMSARGLTIDGLPPVDPTPPPPPPTKRSPTAAPDPRLTMEWLEGETLWPRAELELIIDAITGSSPQVVLAGPPGTGKTWVAQRIARYLTGGVPGTTRTVQFHPSYAYEQFIEGLRPVVEPGGGIAFRRVDGVVLEIVAGMHAPDDRRVLVIDEMNRANLPRVFGELMYLFEYRQEPIALQYSPSFALPPGLLFIGTMNTADRSIRSLDIALRRRFDVFECPPSSDILRRWYGAPGHTSEVADLVGGFERLNADLTDALDRHHTIGHTFFLSPRMTPQRLRHVWRHKLAPLIEEYFFDQPDVAARFSLGTYWPDAVDAH
jgi:hypothetical protein